MSDVASREQQIRGHGRTVDKGAESPTDEGIGGIAPLRPPFIYQGSQGSTPRKPSPRESIPLHEFTNAPPGGNTVVDRMDRLDRLDSLQKIHAHSSAETSGLGDSLQRIHTLSSTETSGYGDTVPSPTGFDPSPVDPIHGLPVPGTHPLSRPSRSMLHINHPPGPAGTGGHSPGSNPKPHIQGVRMKSASLDDDRYSPTKTHHMYPKQPPYGYGGNPQMGTKRYPGSHSHNPGLVRGGDLPGGDRVSPPEPEHNPRRRSASRQMSADEDGMSASRGSLERELEADGVTLGKGHNPNEDVGVSRILHGNPHGDRGHNPRPPSSSQHSASRTSLRGVEPEVEVRERGGFRPPRRRTLSRQSLQEDTYMYDRPTSTNPSSRRKVPPSRQHSEDDGRDRYHHRTGSPVTARRRHHASDGNLAVSEGNDEHRYYADPYHPRPRHLRQHKQDAPPRGHHHENPPEDRPRSATLASSRRGSSASVAGNPGGHASSSGRQRRSSRDEGGSKYLHRWDASIDAGRWQQPQPRNVMDPSQQHGAADAPPRHHGHHRTSTTSHTTAGSHTADGGAPGGATGGVDSGAICMSGSNAELDFDQEEFGEGGDPYSHPHYARHSHRYRHHLQGESSNSRRPRESGGGGSSAGISSPPSSSSHHHHQRSLQQHNHPPGEGAVSSPGEAGVGGGVHQHHDADSAPTHSSGSKRPRGARAAGEVGGIKGRHHHRRSSRERVLDGGGGGGSDPTSPLLLDSPSGPIPSTSHGVTHSSSTRRTSAGPGGGGEVDEELYDDGNEDRDGPFLRLSTSVRTSSSSRRHKQQQQQSKGGRGPMTRSHKKTASAIDAGLDLDLYSAESLDAGDGNQYPEVVIGVGGRDSRRGSYTPTETPTLSRSGSAQFLGVHTQSTWLKWSQDRRNSYKKRLDGLEQRQKELERTRVSTPVRKARKESVMFVSPELESKHAMEEDDELDIHGLHARPGGAEQRPPDRTQPHAAAPAPPAAAAAPVPVSRKKRLNQKDQGVKLTVNQWNGLLAFWEHSVFVRCRYGGTLLSLLALILTMCSIGNNDWFRQAATSYTGVIYSGLWQECSTTAEGATNCTRLHSRCFSIGIWENCVYSFSATDGLRRICDPARTNWQNAVIGLLLFAVAFGFLATILSICGACTTTLPKKIYYYHSAGEIYFICALSTTAALIVYPVAIETEKRMAEHQYGVGYGLGWGASFFFFAAAMCMCLDDLVRTIAKGFCCGKKDQSQRSRV